jgi:DNA-binding MarR family transcriptional regulator
MKYIHDMADANKALEALFEVAGLLGDSMQRELGTRGLTRARAEVIWRLAQSGSLTQTDLSRALRCTPRNVTGLLDALENAALIIRRPHPDDRRATLVSLTARGTRASAAWAKNYEKLASTLFANIDSNELGRFIRTLDGVLGRLRGVCAGDTSPSRSVRRTDRGV